MSQSSGLRGGRKLAAMFPPVLNALRELGGSARAPEVIEIVAAALNISNEERDARTSNGQRRFDNQVAWARFYLAKAGFIDSSKHGVWSLTDKGRDARMTFEDALEVVKQTRAQMAATASTTGQEEADEDDNEGGELAPEAGLSTATLDHRKSLLEILMKMSGPGFERFSQRLLRESGFQNVVVTGRANDGGIDGIGILQINPLVSFKVLFQCKRYQNSVAPSHVRDFRGAMQGRADKGIIITTGTFTVEAKKEAVRDGVPPIELVDGEKLIEMLESLELGLIPVRAFQVDDKFFDDFLV